MKKDSEKNIELVAKRLGITIYLKALRPLF